MVARVHDESHVNRFWASHPPARILTAAYMYPEVLPPPPVPVVHPVRVRCQAASAQVRKPFPAPALPPPACICPYAAAGIGGV